jgi:hypothetical protein
LAATLIRDEYPTELAGSLHGHGLDLFTTDFQ